jgi:uncharacterized membrane protein YbhN (UPF0104 family)
LSEARRSRVWGTAARLAVSIALLWLVSRFVDAGAVLSRLSQLRPGWVALALAITVAQVAVLAWRWRFTAARLGIEMTPREALAEYYFGILLNQLLPGGVAGDASRAWRHTRQGAPTGPAVRAVILERASAQVVMTLTALASVFLLPWARGPVRAALAGATLVLGGLVLRSLARRSESDAAPDSLVGRFWADTRHAVLARSALMIQLASALLVVASYILVFLLAARAVGVETPAARMLPLVAPVLMTMLVPVTIAGWGVREGAAAALWGLVGLTPEDGAAISVTYGLLVLVSSAPGLVVLTRTVIGGRGRRERPPRA